MIIGATSIEFDRWGEEKYIKMREHGFGAVDYDMCKTDIAPFTLNDSEAEAFILAEKEKITSAGLVISQVHGPWNGGQNDGSAEGRAERMEKMKRSIKFCSILECKYWVVHPIFPCNCDEKNDPVRAQETWDVNIQFMKELLEVAKKFNVVICFENMPMPHFSLGSPQNILRFVKEINDDNFKICFDTGHATMFSSKSVGDHIRELGNYIKVFHIHDNNGWADLHLPPYFGVIDWVDFKKALKDIAFEGVFSLEVNVYSNMPKEEYEKFSKLKYSLAKKIINS